MRKYEGVGAKVHGKLGIPLPTGEVLPPLPRLKHREVLDGVQLRLGFSKEFKIFAKELYMVTMITKYDNQILDPLVSF